MLSLARLIALYILEKSGDYTADEIKSMVISDIAYNGMYTEFEIISAMGLFYVLQTILDVIKKDNGQEKKAL